MKALVSVILFVFSGAVTAAMRLPVFLADNHAGTHAWIARTFDPDKPMTLVLVDAHTDATAAERSDELREQLRRVAGIAERDQHLESWRASGRIQAFNWIEPLMPRPLDSVFWIARPQMDESSRRSATGEAIAALDGRLEFEPRSAGSFSRRWHTLGLSELGSWKPPGEVVLSIDLDFFAGSDRAEGDFQILWKSAMSWPGLRGVSVAVSRPWLRDDREADTLVAMAIDAVRRTRGADLEIDATVDDRFPDDSLRHADFRLKQQAVPHWDLSKSSPRIHRLLEMAPPTWTVSDRKPMGRKSCHNDQMTATIEVSDQSPDCDGVVRLDGDRSGLLRVQPAGDGDSASGKVRWFVRCSVQPAYDLLPETGLGKGFANSPGRWIYEERIALGETTDFALPARVWRAHLDPALHGGRVIVEADYETHAGWMPVRPLDLRVRRGTGFQAALSECFGMPYVFGVALCGDGGLHGVDTGWGADCSNFIAHAWRCCGVPVSWGDPAALRCKLTTIANSAHPGSRINISPKQVATGLVVDFGGHVAALWEDREPRGILDGGDLLAHHLDGRPELVRLEQLARNRPPFAVRVLPETRLCKLAIAGDVVPSEDAEGWNELATRVAGADLVLANLEGIPSQLEPDDRPAHDFRFPRARVELLKQAGIHVVSLANNHAGDAGLAGITEGREILESEHIGVVGGGRNLDEAIRPWIGSRHGQRLAVFGVCAVKAPIAGPDTPGVASLPEHKEVLEGAIRAQARSGAIPVVLVHWGTEHQEHPDEEQLQWSRWLANTGARVIAGSGPHMVQKTAIHAGGLIHYSTGNAVYPKKLLGRGDGEVWHVAVAGNAVPEHHVSTIPFTGRSAGSAINGPRRPRQHSR